MNDCGHALQGPRRATGHYVIPVRRPSNGMGGWLPSAACEPVGPRTLRSYRPREARHSYSRCRPMTAAASWEASSLSKRLRARLRGRGAGQPEPRTTPTCIKLLTFIITDVALQSPRSYAAAESSQVFALALPSLLPAELCRQRCPRPYLPSMHPSSETTGEARR